MRAGRASRSTAATAAIIRNFARYAECDVKGQLNRYDQNNNFLVAYNSGALTGNDADAVALAYYNSAVPGAHGDRVLVLRRPRRGRGVHACSATPPRPPR